jgi:hypothetical protein
MIAKSEELGTSWAKLTDKGYKFDIDSMEEFADAMGTSTEFAEYMLMAMKDAAYDVDISRIGDRYAETFDKIVGTEANAG